MYLLLNIRERKLISSSPEGIPLILDTYKEAVNAATMYNDEHVNELHIAIINTSILTVVSKANGIYPLANGNNSRILELFKYISFARREVPSIIKRILGAD